MRTFKNRMMKKKIVFVGLLMVGLLSATMLGCKKIDPTKGVVKIVDATFAKASVSLQFVDARTGEQLDLDGARNISISVTGRNASDVVDNFGGSKYGADYGIMAVAIREGVVPSKSNQVAFTIHSQTEGYLDASTDVVISQEGHQHFIVNMIKIGDAPAGITIKDDMISGVPSTGILESAFSLSPNALPSSGTTASVTIPSGTKLMDKNSSAVSGNVTATIAYSNPKEAAFGNQFPGSPDVATLDDGSFVSFQTYALVSMDMISSNGKEVKKFGSPIQMNLEIPDGLGTLYGTTVAAGTTVGIYSYDDATGKWKHEGNEKIVMNSNLKLEVNFEMTHLSSWQVGTAVPSYGYDESQINNITFKGSCDYYLKTQSDIVVEVRCENYPIHEATAVTIANQTTQIPAHNSCNTGKYRWYKKGNPSDYVEASANLNQPNQTVTFPSSWCPKVTPKDFTIKLETNCPDNPDRKIKPQGTIFAVPEGGGNWILLGRMESGELKTSTANLEPGQKYALLTFYQNKIVYLTGTLANLDFGYRTFDGSDVDLSRPLTASECTYLKTK